MKSMKKRLFFASVIATLALSLTACSTVQANKVSNGVSASQQIEDWKPYDEKGEMIRGDRGGIGKVGVVSTGKFEASKIGREILRKGGNAIDAAVAS